MEKSKNLIVLSGTILSIRENKKNTVLIVKSKGESKEANVEFVFYDTSVLKGITPKMKVKIRAHGENRKSEDGFGNAYYVKEFVGDKIEQQKRMLAPYVCRLTSVQVQKPG